MKNMELGFRSLAIALVVTLPTWVGCGADSGVSDDANATTATQAIIPDGECPDGDCDDGCGDDGKVTICHKTGSAKNPVVELRINCHAVPAHLKKGDFLPFDGSCTAPPPPPPAPTAH
jgi:hypothetical protein